MCKDGFGENLESAMNDQIESHASVNSESDRHPVEGLFSILAAVSPKITPIKS